MPVSATRPYPRLSEEQKACILTELALEFALNNLRPAEATDMARGTSLGSDMRPMGVAAPLDPLAIQPALVGLDQETTARP
jgi:hypothetical protein